MEKMIPVAINRWDLADEYNRHAAATMVSIMENCSKPIEFHILYGDTQCENKLQNIDENINKYKNLVLRYGSEVHFHRVILPSWIYDISNNSAGKWSPAVFFRIYLPDILSNHDKVISLGCDVIVRTDLAKLYEIDIKKYSLAGVLVQELDETIKNNKELRNYFETINMPLSSYVCADVLMFNLKKIRNEKTLPNLAIKYLRSHPDSPMMEQDAFNIIFKNDIFLLPEKYNLATNHRIEKIDTILLSQIKNHEKLDYIIHFAGKAKPWNEHISGYDMIYWIYLYKTPWGEEDVTFSYAQNGNFTPYKIIENIDEYIWRETFSNKIASLWRLTIPLYIKIIKRYYNEYHGTNWHKKTFLKKK